MRINPHFVKKNRPISKNTVSQTYSKPMARHLVPKKEFFITVPKANSIARGPFVLGFSILLLNESVASNPSMVKSTSGMVCIIVVIDEGIVHC